MHCHTIKTQSHPEEAIHMDSEGGVCVERVVVPRIDGAFQEQFTLHVADEVSRIVDRLEADRAIASVQAWSLLDEAAYSIHTRTQCVYTYAHVYIHEFTSAHD